ncbi:hypothetical protein H5P36_26030 [Bacillus sp. APMAM]|nr:hypothetical protein [Bacillus sp. APMAM]RTZ51693.1 hypothetical protein EKO25_25895 [Bacillus sp. SAJ1]
MGNNDIKYWAIELNSGVIEAIRFLIRLTGSLDEQSSLACIQQSGQIVEQHILSKLVMMTRL